DLRGARDRGRRARAHRRLAGHVPRRPGHLQTPPARARGRAARAADDPQRQDPEGQTAGDDPVTGPLPLAGVKVLDLSPLLPGPRAPLMPADAGADVVKRERPGRGDEMRSYEPKFGEASANYAVLNRGKRAYAVDLKDPSERDRVLDLAAEAD